MSGNSRTGTYRLETRSTIICKYMGTKLNLKDSSDKTLEFRLAEAAAKVLSLRKSIRGITGLGCGKPVLSAVPCMDYSPHSPMDRWRPSSGHGSTGNSEQLSVINMPAHLTQVNNRDISAQYGLQDPIQLIAERVDRKKQAMQQGHGDPATRAARVMEYWETLRQQKPTKPVLFL